MAFNLDTFRSGLQYDGARPNLFEVILIPPVSLPAAAGAGQQLTLMARSTQIPGKTIGVVPLYYFGREIKIPGNPVYQEWTMTVYNDEDFLIRGVMERWQGAINSNSNNIRMSGFIAPTQYSVNGSVIQYSKMGAGGGGPRGRPGTSGGPATSQTGIRRYNMVGCWPVDVSPIELDWGANDQIEEFSLTLAYQWWEVEREDATISARTAQG
jgi:hypothetical protein